MGTPRWTTLALVCLLGCKSSSNQPPPPAEPPPPAGPRLVVLLVIDQLPTWGFERDVEFTTAGIAKLRHGGVYYPRSRFPFANTHTATGHAALGTGAPPSVTGILGNSYYDRALGKKLSSVLDEEAPLLSVLPNAPLDPERARADGASSKHLRVDGVADVLAREHPTARSISIAIKDRGAILALGRRPNLAIWYDPAQAAMTTSRFYVEAPPAWLTKLPQTHPVAGYFEQVWEPADAARLAHITGVPDDRPGESSEHGLDTTFPHPLVGESRARAFRSTPMADELLVATALAAVDGEKLGADDVPDLLAISFSAHDYAGHHWGQESWERLDLFLRLDHTIGTLLAGLDERVGQGWYAVVLSSDHGATRLVEDTSSKGREAVRVFEERLVERAQKVAARILGKGSWISAYSDASLYVSTAFGARSEADRNRALDAVVADLAQVPGVAFAARTDSLRGDCDARTGIEASMCRGVSDESGELLVAARPDCVICEARYVTGTSHGSPNQDDTDVPIIVYAADRPPRQDPALVSPLQVAPTLAELLGISAPPATTALPLR